MPDVSLHTKLLKYQMDLMSARMIEKQYSTLISNLPTYIYTTQALRIHI